MDQNGDGFLSRAEIKSGFIDFFQQDMKDDEIEEIISRADFDNNGKISYSEFIVATMKKEELLEE